MGFLKNMAAVAAGTIVGSVGLMTGVAIIDEKTGYSLTRKLTEHTAKSIEAMSSRSNEEVDDSESEEDLFE